MNPTKPQGRLSRLRALFANAFAVTRDAPLSPEDEALLSRLAAAVAKRGMGPPAALFLESLSPLNFVGSQALVFLRPFATAICDERECDRLARILERRDALELLARQVESATREEVRGAS